MRDLTLSSPFSSNVPSRSPSRRRRSHAVKTGVFLSLILHAALFLLVVRFDRPEAGSLPPVMDVFSVSEEQLAAMNPELPTLEARVDIPNARHLTPDEIAALPDDGELLPLHEPSPEAVEALDGQIVELAAPLIAQDAPDDARFLSSANHRVEEEQASRRFLINPSVVAPDFSLKSSLAHERPGDAKARLQGDTALAYGAPGPEGDARVAMRTPGRRAERDERRASSRESDEVPAAPRESDGVMHPPGDDLPPSAASPPLETDSAPNTDPAPALAALDALVRRPDAVREALTGADALKGLDERLQPRALAMIPPASRDGALGPGDGGLESERRGGGGQGGGAAGSAAVHYREGTLHGAPSNDRLDVPRGDSTLLNAREFKYFAYYQLVRRQVNFYWNQALENVGRIGQKLNRREYTTTLHIVLDVQGRLKSASIVRSSGVKPFDDATLQAFRIAAPFPPPPKGLVNASGEADLHRFSFTVALTAGTARYSGIDPRSNVLFPGITRIQ